MTDFRCEHEGARCDTKSECLRYGKWTNCREVGHCTLSPEAHAAMEAHNAAIAKAREVKDS